MKKVLLGAACLILLAGCGSQKKYEKTMKDYATKYYEAHLKGQVNQTNPVITIDMLKKAIEQVGDSYDMDKLKACKDTSSIEIILKEGTNEIDSYKYKMECE